jgi:geranylgeranylglycerol-phosphate geranylgeranyltransferase
LSSNALSTPSKPSSPSKLSLYLQLARPFTLLPPLLGIVSGSVCAFGSAHNPDPMARLTSSVLLTVVLGSLCASFMNAASNAINQIYDLEIDRLNKPDRPLVTGALSIREAWVFSWIFYVLALVPTWLVVPYPYETWSEKLFAPLAAHQTFFIYLAGLIFTFVYSAPGLGRTKTRGMLANFTIAIPRGVLLKVAGWAMVATVWATEPWFLGAVIGIFLIGAASTKDFADIPGDQAGGCKTLPIVYGVEKAAWIISPFFVLPWLLLPVGAFMSDPQNPSHPILTGNAWLLACLGIGLALWGAYTVYLLVRDPASLTATENHPSWRHMYLMLMAAQIGLALAYLVP